MSREFVPIALIGGGIGGLTAGLELRRRGVGVTVLEQTEAFGQVGAGVAIGANGSRLLHRLGLAADLGRVACRPARAEFRHWSTGKVFQSHELAGNYEHRFGAPFYTVHRADLQQLLRAEYLRQGGELRTGHKCTGVTEHADRVEIDFADGRRVDAGVVVGADGVHSVVRGSTIGDDSAVFSGTSGYRGLARADRLDGELGDPALWMFLGPRQHLIAYPVRGGELVNFLAVVRDPQWTLESWVSPGRVSDVLAAFEEWSPLVQGIIGATEEVSRWALYDREPLSRWSTQRTTLLGDAAHPMLPHHGQGANQSIEDAVVLGGALASCGRGEESEALRLYERLRRARTRQVQAGSRRNAECFQLPDGPAADKRNEWLRELPDNLAWIHGYDAAVEFAETP